MERCFPRLSVIITGIVMSLLIIITVVYNGQSLLDSGYIISLSGESPSRNVTRVLLTTYYRGGSSFVGEMFANRPDTFYVFEPLHGLQRELQEQDISLGGANPLIGSYLLESRGHDRKYEMQSRIDALQQIFDCSIPEMDRDILLDIMFTHATHMPLFKEYKVCMWSERLQTCTESLANKCLEYPTLVVKTIRYPMYAVPWLLELLPDLQVIAYIRDPRAILSSRYHLSVNRKTPLEKSASDLCRSMADNYVDYVFLKSRYPGNIFLVKYEDLASYPEETTRQMYRFAGLGDALPSGVREWIDENTKSKSHMFNAYGTHRVSSSRIDRWKNFWPKEDMDTIIKACNETLNLLGYEE